MNAVDKAIQRANVRLLLHRWVRYMGWCSAIALLLACAILFVDRQIDALFPLWGYGILFILATVVSLLWTFLTHPSKASVAVMVDDRLKLKDRLGTALHVREQDRNNPFAKAMLADAENVASSTQLRQAFSVRMTAIWQVVCVLAIGVAASAWFIPEGDAFGIKASVRMQKEQEENYQRASEEITLVNARIQDIQMSETRFTQGDPTELLENLMNMDAQALRDPDKQREAISQLSDVRQRFVDEQEMLSLQLRAIKNAMTRLESEQAGPADDFVNALRRGDFQEAQRQLQRLADQLQDESLTSQEREAASQQLQNLSTQLSSMAQQASTRQQQAQQQIENQLKEMGMSQEQINQLTQQGFDQQQLQQALEQHLQSQGMDGQQAQQQAQQMAQQMQSQQQHGQSQGESAQACSSLGDSLEKMAQAMQQQQASNGDGGNGEPSNMGEAQSSAQQQLNQLAQMQQSMQRMQQGEQQAHNAMQRLSQQPQQQGGSGRQAGTGDGGNPYGAERRYAHQHHTVKDLQDRPGPVIASWMETGEMTVGQSTVEYDEAVTQARENATRAVTEDRVPQRYHATIRTYFNQMPEDPQEIRKPPAAPR